MININIKSFLAVAALAAGANAAEILVSADISTSTTWTANNTYNLQTQIYVLPGATLTIEPGTVIASTPTTNGGGSIAVCKGAQIIANGTRTQPIIFTSTADVATWVNGDPKTGTWRAIANEWGNLTIMGDAYISENAIATNTATPNASNYANMEGLTAASATDTRVRYGGGNDDDDSGSLKYVSIRYAGRVVGLNNELNGLSLGGIGRNTEISHIEIMNNVDDGIEIWGGTVNLKNFAVWNIGDDSLDIDQGYRGKIQYGLIVQGYSALAAQGSGIGDNAIEVDGAEQSDFQPVTTTTMYNMTVIGQPVSGDHGVAYRDNARVQVRNSIFMDLGERAVAIDNVDGDGGLGYGYNGTLAWATTWTTPYNTFSTVNAPANPAAFYTVQSSGFLNEITDSVYFRNLNAAAYTEANNRAVFAAGNNNVQVAGSAAADAPIASITRGPNAIFGTLVMQPVTALDPRPRNAALTSVNAAPADGFFTPAQYRGAFAPTESWLGQWTASYAFGFTPNDSVGTAFCFGDGSGTACPCANSGTAGNGCANSVNAAGANLAATGVASLTEDSVSLRGSGMPNSAALYFQGTTQGGAGLGTVFGDGLRCAAGSVVRLGTATNAAGRSAYPFGTFPSVSVKGFITAPGTRTYQVWYRNAAAFCTASTFNLSNGVSIVWHL
jgi:hypothetical protein